MNEPLHPLDSFKQRVLHTVASIPYGHVCSYGTVARRSGSARAARQVGAILKHLPDGHTLPWHRVVNRYGQISLSGQDHQRQKKALMAEGIVFAADDSIDLSRYEWLHEPETQA